MMTSYVKRTMSSHPGYKWDSSNSVWPDSVREQATHKVNEPATMTRVKAVALVLMSGALILELLEFSQKPCDEEKVTLPDQKLDYDSLLYQPSIDSRDRKDPVEVPSLPIPLALQNDSFCVPWEIDTDVWWTHHPEWFHTSDNETHTCFQRRDNDEALYLLRLYENQYNNDCSKVWSRFIWCSGWGSDLLNIVKSMIKSLRLQRPMAPTKFDPMVGWHYAAVKGDGSNAACSEKDLTCYFLPLTNCRPNRKNIVDDYPHLEGPEESRYDLVYDYVTRPRQWLRRDVFDFVQKVQKELVQPCAVIHVRRADVVLHQDHSRKYYPITAYVEKLPTERRQDILLLTDDANAIDEAHEFFPNIHWHYINRTRHRGSEGGWENQTPSKNPKQEVITILGTFQLVRMCDTFVHGFGSFSEDIYRNMKAGGRTVNRIMLDQGTKEIHSAANKNSEKDLEKLLSVKRNQTQ